MIIAKQPKKSNNNIRYSLGNNPQLNSQISGKLVKKNRPLKQKLHKNLSQLPCGLINDSKQNASLSNLMIARPHSSLIGSDVSRSLSKQKQKADINSFCKDKIKLKKISSKRNTLNISEIPIKGRGTSVVSNSNNKWNNRSVEEDPHLLKAVIAENRKKYNLSCGDMIEPRSKCKQNKQKGHKKKSVLANKNTSKVQSKKLAPKQSENDIKKFKPVNMGQKSKGNTGAVNINQNTMKTKKKQNKQNKKKHQRSKSKSKNKKSKSNKMFVLFKGDSDEEKSVQQFQYPINKYVDMKKKAKKSLNIKVGLDYNFSCLNIGSNSSGIINQQFSSSIEPMRQSKLLPYSDIQENSINMEQIKYYQQHSPLKNRKPKLQKNRKFRNEILQEIEQQYPYLNTEQLDFLSCVVLIQRKWKQVLLYRRLDQRKQIVTEYLQQPQNSKEDKDHRQKPQKHSNQKLRLNQLSRTKIAQFQVQQETKHQTKAKGKIQQQVDCSQLQSPGDSHQNQIIIYSNDPSEIDKIQTNKMESIRQKDELTDRKPMTESSKVIVNYTWMLSRQVFPEVNYLQYRKNIIRQGFQKTMKLISQQRKARKISQKQFQFRKNDLTSSYQKEISQLKKTKHDIKKGYLKYIDCINKIKQIRNPNDPIHKTDNKYGLRKVSSDSNFLKNLYQKIFRFDNCISEWSGGSQSIEMLTKKILIRKQFYKPDKKSERRSLSDIRSAVRSSFQKIYTCRQPQSNTVVIFQHTDRFINIQNSQQSQQKQPTSAIGKFIKQFKFSNEIFRSKQMHEPGKLHQKQKPIFNQGSQENEQKLYQQNYEKKAEIGNKYEQRIFQIQSFNQCVYQQEQQNLHKTRKDEKSQEIKPKQQKKKTHEQEGYTRTQKPKYKHRRQPHSPQFESSTPEVTKIQDKIHEIEVTQNLSKLTNSIYLVNQSQQRQKILMERVEQQIIKQLAKQLERDIYRINPVLIDIILINQPELSSFEGIDIGQDEEQQIKSPAMAHINRQLATLTSPRNTQSDRHIYNRQSEMEPQSIISYLYGLVSYINKKKWGNDILENMNNNQTFQPLSYLKFLRDFQIPDDEYTPIIDNERFVQWQTYYNNNEQRNRNVNKQSQHNRNQQENQLMSIQEEILRQSQAIFHRCVFEVFLGQLQKNRPYGERGRPFPWEQKYSCITIRQIAQQQLSQVIKKSLHRVQQYLIYRCGLITQKIFIANQQQLERAHQENEDRIIQMLQQDLQQTNHQWYEVQEHILEIKLQISYVVQELLFEEMGMFFRQLGIQN